MQSTQYRCCILLICFRTRRRSRDRSRERRVEARLGSPPRRGGIRGPISPIRYVRTVNKYRYLLLPVTVPYCTKKLGIFHRGCILLNCTVWNLMDLNHLSSNKHVFTKSSVKVRGSYFKFKQSFGI